MVIIGGYHDSSGSPRLYKQPELQSHIPGHPDVYFDHADADADNNKKR